jgi:mono/diheme cytochrome c family protein
MDMQDQPRYEAFERGDTKTFPDGQSSRQLVEGTVPRGPAGQPFVDRQSEYFYTGRMPGAQGAGGASATGVGAPFGMTGAGTQATGQGTTTTTAPAGGAAPGGGAAAAAQASARLGGADVFPTQVVIDEAALRRGQDRYNNFCSMCHGLTGDGDGMIVRRGFQRPPSLHDAGLQEPQASAAHVFQTITNGLGAMPSYATMLPPEDRWKIVAYVRAMQLSRRVNAGELSEEERGRIGARQQTGTQPAHGGQQH